MRSQDESYLPPAIQFFSEERPHLPEARSSTRPTFTTDVSEGERGIGFKTLPYYFFHHEDGSLKFPFYFTSAKLRQVERELRECWETAMKLLETVERQLRDS